MMENKLKVAFCGGEGLNWALDHDLEHVRRITSDFVEEVPLAEAELVHSVWWRGIMHIPAEDLKNKVVIASIADDPKTMMSDPEYLVVRRHITAWLSEYSQSQEFVIKTGQNCFRFPDPIELNVFSSPGSREESRQWLHREFGVPLDPYLIGNFHRDSSMTNLEVPKKQKGADLFLEIATALIEAGNHVYFLLAGPRRHYLRKHFKARGIPYTFVGTEIDEDDVEVNTRSLDEVAKIMRALDLYLITSRWEGAPNTLLEAVSSETCILSTPVGQAEDILYPEQIFRGVSDGVELIEKDLEQKHLAGLRKAGLSVLQKWNTDEALARRLRHIYFMAMRTSSENPKRLSWIKKKGSLGDGLRKSAKQHKAISYSIIVDSGTRQEKGHFWTALMSRMQQQGLDVSWNRQDADCLLIDGCHFQDHQHKPSRRQLVQHWVGGVSDFDGESLSQMVQWNQKYADLTVFASGWAAQEVLSHGYKFKNPMLIRRGVDSDIYQVAQDASLPEHALRLISCVPGNIPADTYSAFVELSKQMPETIEAWTLITDNQPSGEEWATQLGTHDVYVELNAREATGTYAAQALGCGLPVLHQQGGAVPELSEFGSLPFSDIDSFKVQLARLQKHYKHYRQLIWLPDMDDIVDQIKLGSSACKLI
ncbi:MAG: glycosyltransferase [Verrucomicrobiota bacterium]